MDLRSKDAIESSKQHDIDMSNILIAEFMQKGSEGFGFYDFDGCHYRLNGLKFYSSWDWLMPVVQKIESLGYVFTIQGGKAEYGEMISETRCFIAENKRSSTYKAVVEFIKNQNN